MWYPFSLLLSKLESIGVRGLQLFLFESYLSNGRQLVQIGCHRSEELNIISHGVPQGSILGPALFLVFVNDLCNIKFANDKLVSFADDTALFTAKSWNDLLVDSQCGFNTVMKWLLAHSLSLNTSKTTFITYSLAKSSQPKTLFNLSYHIMHAPKHIRYLGLILDQHLNFKFHINAVSNKVRKLIYIFK